MPEALTPRAAEALLRPLKQRTTTLRAMLEYLHETGRGANIIGNGEAQVTGICLDSRAVLPGDLYVAAPGARFHGAQFAAAAAQAGAAAILTDIEGEAAASALGLPVLLAGDVREVVGELAALIYGTDEDCPELFGLTGTNGKTTTSYMIRSVLGALGRETGLVGTIEISAGQTPIPSILTTPEAPQLHGLMARMRELGVTSATMEVSSHSLSYRRVDGLRFAVSGFTNLTQDHLDLHGSMQEYFATKAELFDLERSDRAVITVDDDWGRAMAAQATAEVWTLATTGTGTDADWAVANVLPAGLGHRFELHGPGEQVLTAVTGLPGDFNVSNAALAVVMVLASGVEPGRLQAALDAANPLTVQVPGRMQVIAESPAAIVDFAHNPDALARALGSVRSAEPGSRVIVVFGATGERDATKRPVMGAVAARHADVVIVTDDDPHSEDPSGIREAVAAGARAEILAKGLGTEVHEIHPRAAAIAAAAAMAGEHDTILVAGRGHEVFQEVMGVNLELDDRQELRRALLANGFQPLEPASGSIDPADEG
ncbi:UDP-N-acetylmuramoyl-L-alanyl-D-glutamate--2,6-diaminopimelate ligase [Paeniglutamicibacter psychrophenolicus]|uniref:UDP-N-acetylmuramoyl-L-alanyl-D-glutamate--2, 6-diaminopimelate ligase n=1 Tax=Paeniglutamicibacter psychrophenolicus TaxID=257454 RepID=UPI0027816C9A|nr:UDP-N-acetylmuramoyl-L-alanyl-D-glutamate--2,6-diaminopimelate ligase [Paeniglutamicibacter psychrophenolicus]MDQ0094377.1 UDP-N-acetylmuramoyl-L-alanyl-D-glutamate--2,6-diaminopimelate ligase [Paeniglutamicibacter psychrophenolicus]